jgi:hypothetical protein
MPVRSLRPKGCIFPFPSSVRMDVCLQGKQHGAPHATSSFLSQLSEQLRSWVPWVVRPLRELAGPLQCAVSFQARIGMLRSSTRRLDLIEEEGELGHAAGQKHPRSHRPWYQSPHDGNDRVQESR